MIRVKTIHIFVAPALLCLICSFAFRIIPVVTLAGKTKGSISAEIFTAISELELAEVRGSHCEIAVYTLFHIPFKCKIEEYSGATRNFTAPITKAMQGAKSGDKYIFYNVKVLCDGDKKPIKVNHLNFNIK